MTLFISNFKPVWLALGVIAVIETVVAFGGEKLGANHFRTNFVQMGYHLHDNLTKYVWEIKMDLLPRLKPVFLQVGDSSGNSLKPAIIEPYLNGQPYVLMSCCADAWSYRGHRNMAEGSLKKVDTIKYIVFNVSPHSGPALFKKGTELADSVYSEFVSSSRLLYPPSMALRTLVTNTAYYLEFAQQ